jgi:hypothetical protein
MKVIDIVNKALAELTSLYVMRKDSNFKHLFQVDEHFDEVKSVIGRTNETRQLQSTDSNGTRYVSFMSSARAMSIGD